MDINQRFEILKNLASMVIDGHTPSLIICGQGGLGKTHSVKSIIEEKQLFPFEWVMFSGYSTARGLYNTLFDNRDKLIVFDDCDSVLEDKVAINILKSALDSYDKRTISWMSKMRASDEYPHQFDFSGRIIFISNKKRESIDSAILSRSLTVDLSMTGDEKIMRMSHIISSISSEIPIDVKRDALSFLAENKDHPNVNLRTLIMISKMRKSFPEQWQDMANYMLNSQSQF